MDKEDILTNGEKKIFYILVSICLFAIFIYFIVKVLMRYKLKNNASWTQIFMGYMIGEKCKNNGECVSNNCLQNICMV
jgi:hypothetical protein